METQKKDEVIVKKSKKWIIPVVGTVLVTGFMLVAITIVATIIIFSASGNSKLQEQLDLGQKYISELNYDQAIVAYEEAIKIDPKSADAYIGLARTYMEMGDYQSALSVLQEGYANTADERILACIDDINELINSQNTTFAQMLGTITIADEDTDYGNNLPIYGAQVSLVSLDTYNSYSETATTDENGEYVFDGLMAGEYELTVEKDGYLPLSQNVSVYEGQDIFYNTMLEVMPENWSGLGTASGVVYDAVTGYGVSGLTLNIRQGINQLDGQIVSSFTTMTDGYYITPDLESGNYTIEILDERGLEGEQYLSNIINVKVLGNRDIPNQDGVVSTTMLSGQVRIVMSWGEKPYDLDSHLFCSLNNGKTGHVYYGNPYFYVNDMRIADLDLDDTDSYGPETTTIYTPDAGVYTFGVYNFSYDYAESLMNSGGTVSVYLGNSVIPSYVFNVPREAGYYWEIFSYDSTTQSLTPINRVDDYYDSTGYDEDYYDPYYYEDDYYEDNYYNDDYYDSTYYEDDYYGY